MLLRPLREEEKELYNSVVHHPLQTWEWGNFRQKTGIKVERVGFFQNGKLDHALQVFFHPIPGLGSMTAGYFPKGQMPDDDQLSALKQLGKKYNAVFVKMEPDIGHKVDTPSGLPQVANFLQKNGAVPGRPLRRARPARSPDPSGSPSGRGAEPSSPTGGSRIPW